MPRVLIKSGAHSEPGKPRLGWDTAIEVDGKPLLDTTDITLRFPVDGAATAEVHLLLTDEFTFEGQMDLHLHLHLQEGDTMAEVTAPGDTNRKHIVLKRGQ